MFYKFIDKLHQHPYILLGVGFLILAFSNLFPYITNFNGRYFGTTIFFGFAWIKNTYPSIASGYFDPNYAHHIIWTTNFLPQAVISIILSILSILSFVVLIVLFLKKKKAFYFASLPFALALIAHLSLGDLPFVDGGGLPYFIINLLLFIISVAYTILVAYNEKHGYVPKERTPRPHKPTQAERIAELEKQVEELKNNQK